MCETSPLFYSPNFAGENFNPCLTPLWTVATPISCCCTYSLPIYFDGLCTNESKICSNFSWSFNLYGPRFLTKRLQRNILIRSSRWVREVHCDANYDFHFVRVIVTFAKHVFDKKTSSNERITALLKIISLKTTINCRLSARVQLTSRPKRKQCYQPHKQYCQLVKSSALHFPNALYVYSFGFLLTVLFFNNVSSLCCSTITT